MLSDVASALSPTGSFVEDVRSGLSARNDQEVEAAVHAVLETLCDNLPARATFDFANLMPAPTRDWMLATCYEPHLVVSQSEPGSLVLAVASRLPPAFPVHPCLVARVVLSALAKQIGASAALDIIAMMPSHLRKLWPRDAWQARQTAV